MYTRKKCALPNGSIVHARYLFWGQQCDGHSMLMSEWMRENGITPDQVHIIDTEREFELNSKNFISASSFENIGGALL